MINAFILEWLKLRHYRIFWILFGIYLLAQLTITSGGVYLLKWLQNQGVDFDGISPLILPIYDFPDIWQNIAWLGSFLKIFISFIVIISVSNELLYNTIRQNIIDGLSKKAFVLSKCSLIVFLAGACTLVLLFSGLITGFTYSSVTAPKYVFDEMEYILAYFYQLVAFCMLAFLLAIMIKKTGITMIMLILYSSFLEPIATSIIKYADYVKEHIGWAAGLFPVYAINNLIDVPFTRYFFQEIQDDILWHEWLIVSGWLVIFVVLIVYILNKRDVK